MSLQVQNHPAATPATQHPTVEASVGKAAMPQSPTLPIAKEPPNVVSAANNATPALPVEPSQSSTSESLRDRLSDLFSNLTDNLFEKGQEWLQQKLSDLLRPSADGQADVSTTPPATTTAPEGAVPGAGELSESFQAAVTEIIKPNAAGQVHEEELYAALVHERLGSLIGPEAAKEYTQALQTTVGENTRADGYVNIEQAAVSALRQLVERGVVTPEQADQIHSQAFAGAQLDSNDAALYDDRGSAGDPTIAVADFAFALRQAEQRLAAFDSGEMAAPSQKLSEAGGAGTAGATGTVGAQGAAGANGGFLFKPNSESDGKLVILLPASFAGQVESVSLVGRDGQSIEEGRYTSTANGGRPHFRFQQAGGEYPGGLTVVVRLSDRSTRTFEIPDPSKRVES